ncbi:glycosyltransferase family 4 protein [Cyanobium sp. Aljojuca 7D2]|uniref:glycosyltransferase family 4 protein n=1 Tax=Cyanobium sp. Aljojuca 7D2 TaxID=2823698 RepID=UPI0020CF1BBC|nr:glycosyltransferase family 4 protein [Cyanobium sp. Aljojuca 7D2]MCP9892076.1 glycosyltransferase family 4 protein [Cyanobium sp. Aljojuca 7D2]
MPRLWLINQFANTPELPGHTRQYEVAAGLVRYGWQVAVFASDFNLTQRRYRRLRFPRLWSTECPAGIHWTWLWVSPYRRNNWKRQLNMLSFCIHLAVRLGPAALLGRLTRRAPDVILASSPQLPAAFTCLWIARLAGIPFVLEVRDLWPQVLVDQGGKSPHSPMVRLLAWMERQLYRHAHTVVVLAKGAEAYVRERGARQTAWLPNGPDLELFASRPVPAEGTLFTVLYAGAHGDANALENVLAAARLLEQQQSPVRIRFVGDGPEKQTLMQLAADLQSVAFEPPVAKAEIPGLMAEADAILLSLRDVPLFRYGVSPNKLYDAYAIGRPVITTVAGAINAEVEEYRLGVTAPPGDPEALAAAILRLVHTPRAERQAMGQRAIELAHTTYSRQRINAQYNALLRGVMA